VRKQVLTYLNTVFTTELYSGQGIPVQYVSWCRHSLADTDKLAVISFIFVTNQGRMRTTWLF